MASRIPARRFFIELPESAFERLTELAHAERRPVRDQAALVLERVLEPQVARDARVAALGGGA